MTRGRVAAIAATGAYSYSRGFSRVADRNEPWYALRLGELARGARRHCHRSAGAEDQADDGEYVPMNIQVKDPMWPMRDMLDFSFSVKPGETLHFVSILATASCPMARAFISRLLLRVRSLGPKRCRGRTFG